jgi:hypothetical protein
VDNVNKIAIRLNDGNHAIVQTCGLDKKMKLSARIGIILPHTKCIEFLKINGWDAQYKGVSDSIRYKLLEIYKKNQVLIHKKILKFIG